jgi:hypothetical protein
MICVSVCLFLTVELIDSNYKKFIIDGVPLEAIQNSRVLIYYNQ